MTSESDVAGIPSETDRARQYAARAEQKAAMIEGIDPAAMPADLSHACVIGGGQMGTGIATALLENGLAVTMMETSQANIENAASRIRANWANGVKRGKLTEADVEERLSRFDGVTDLAEVRPTELFIEAVWEDMALKQQIFRQLAAAAPDNAVLATNTSSLDVNDIAAATGRPADVVGLHFFSPAHIMRLLEVVRGQQTSDRCLATAMALAHTLNKVAVVVGICNGFVGNRIFAKRDQQAIRMLIEGATPAQIDKALEQFGFAMGTFTLFDMVGGIELNWRLRQQTGEEDAIGDALYAAGRLGQRVGKGYYRYEPGSRTPTPDPEVDAIIAAVRERKGVKPRDISEQEILDRMILPMINEAARIVDEGIAQRASDVDVVWNTGYGWPLDKGGLTYYGDRLALPHVRDRLQALQAQHGDHFAVSPLLEKLARDGERLSGI